jgi:hypothetical protein
MDEIGAPPRKGVVREVGETVVEAGVSAIPVAGGPLAVILMRLLGLRFQKRQQDFIEELAAAVQDLIDTVDEVSPEALAENDEFLDAVAGAVMSAQLTGQQEKLDALRNAVLNAALPSDLDADQQAIFLRHISDFTPSHLRLLRLLSDPQAWFAEQGKPWPDGLNTGSLWTLVEWGMPELAGKRELADQLLRDLTSSGMTTTSGLGAMMSAEGLKARRATETGAAFVAFITDPRHNDPVAEGDSTN